MNMLLWALWFPLRSCGSCWSYTHSNADSWELWDPMWHFAHGGSSLPLLFLGIFFPHQLRAQHIAEWPREALGKWGSLEGAALLLCRASLKSCFSVCKSTVPLSQFVPSENRSGQKPVCSGIMWLKLEFWIKFAIQLTIHQCWEEQLQNKNNKSLWHDTSYNL